MSDVSRYVKEGLFLLVSAILMTAIFFMPIISIIGVFCYSCYYLSPVFYGLLFFAIIFTVLFVFYFGKNKYYKISMWLKVPELYLAGGFLLFCIAFIGDIIRGVFGGGPMSGFLFVVAPIYILLFLASLIGLYILDKWIISKGTKKKELNLEFNFISKMLVNGILVMISIVSVICFILLAPIHINLFDNDLYSIELCNKVKNIERKNDCVSDVVQEEYLSLDYNGSLVFNICNDIELIESRNFCKKQVAQKNIYYLNNSNICFDLLDEDYEKYCAITILTHATDTGDIALCNKLRSSQHRTSCVWDAAYQSVLNPSRTPENICPLLEYEEDKVYCFEEYEDDFYSG